MKLKTNEYNLRNSFNHKNSYLQGKIEVKYILKIQKIYIQK